jgi:hypothetical protein
MVRTLAWTTLTLVLVTSSVGAEPVRCRKDADCALLPFVCPSCPPCEGVWREVGSQAQKRAREQQAARSNCRIADRCTCPGVFVGSGALCRAGRCVPEHAPLLGAEPRSTSCTTDGDCVPLPRSGCGCPPCGVVVAHAVNRGYAESLLKEYARESCPKVRCAPCGTMPRSFPTRPVCHARRCTMIPR